MSILSALGFIFLFLICKFIWDTARGTGQETPHASKSSTGKEAVSMMDKDEARAASLNMMAKHLDCMPAHVKLQYQTQLIRQIHDMDEENNKIIIFIENAIKTMRTASYKQAPLLSMNPSDTPPALTAEWAGELLPLYKDAFYKSEEAYYCISPSVNMPKFNLVSISEIKQESTEAPESQFRMIVVYSQSFTYNYTLDFISRSKVDVNISSRNSNRTFAELWTLAELAQANDGTGLAVGDELPGVCISSLSSTVPFHEGQLPFYRSGLYYRTVMDFSEDSQPKDRSDTKFISI